jgi:hypothetical protein
MASHVQFSDFFVLFVSFVVNRLLAGRKDVANSNYPFHAQCEAQSKAMVCLNIGLPVID